MQIFIYRPDLRPNRNIDPNYVFTLDGKPFFELKREEDMVKDYKWKRELEKLVEKPEWKVWSY